ncbi:MAG: cation diffusion facilitator family transporter [Dethiosulfatibacter sp.]|nr:cation diffusion facilitator family transporter [Dethiosulfatibacter sp.]
MNKLLIRIIFKNKKASRKSIGYISALTGAICNITLFTFKLITGLLVNSISITADAFNNLSDLGTNLVSFIGFTLADKPADKDHPFGHGRSEYISAMIISVIILLFSYELIKSSVLRIINPQPVIFKWYVVLILVISILVKLWMAFFNKELNRKIDSHNLDAIFVDSVADVLATSVVLISFILSKYTVFSFDGIAGIFVGLFIGYNGVTILKETLNAIIGSPPKAEEYYNIVNFIKKFDSIDGVHDLIIHDYGPETKLATIHVEMSCDYTFSDAHAIIDTIENRVKEKFGVELVIHIDPVEDACDSTQINKEILEKITSDYDSIKDVHDFRIVNERGQKIIVFDVVVVDTLNNKDIEALRNDIIEKFNENSDFYRIVVNIEKEDTFIYQ